MTAWPISFTLAGRKTMRDTINCSEDRAKMSFSIIAQNNGGVWQLTDVADEDDIDVLLEALTLSRLFRHCLLALLA